MLIRILLLMGRTITLLYNSSYIDDEKAKECKMKFWNVYFDKYNDLHLYPKGCNHDYKVFWIPDEDTTSSDTYNDKFGTYRGLFPLFSEPAIDELVNYFSKLDHAYICFVINDSLSGGEYNYTTRLNCNDKHIDIVIEIMNFDGGMNTHRIELHYKKD